MQKGIYAIKILLTAGRVTAQADAGEIVMRCTVICAMIISSIIITCYIANPS